MSDDKVKPLRPVKTVELSPEQEALRELLKALQSDASSDTLKEIHGVCVYVKDGEVALMQIGGAFPYSMPSEVACELYDLADDIRRERREENQADDEEER